MRVTKRVNFLFLVIGCLILGTESGAAEPEPDIVFPELALPDPPPQPKVSPVTNLPVDRLYVIQSKNKLQIVDFPQGLIKITGGQDAGKLAGRFVDGTGEVEFRTYGKDQWVYVLTAKKGKSGTVEIAVVSSLDKKPIRKKIEVGDDPTPPVVEDEMLREFRKAYAATPDAEKKLAVSLAEFYAEAAVLVKSGDTWVSVYGKMGELATKKGISGRLKAIQDTVEPWLNKAMPTGQVTETRLVTDLESENANNIFNKIAKSLKKVIP